jgi:integrase
MSLAKRGKTWHSHFFVEGQRYRKSLKTSDWREAQKKEKKLIAMAEEGKLSAVRQRFAQLTFREAAEQFLQDRAAKLAPTSVRREREGGKVLNRKLGNLRVARITPDDVAAFMRKRNEEGASAATVNKELGILRGVLKKAKRWYLFTDEIKLLPVRETVGRALSFDEKLRLLKVAVSRPEWQNAAWAATLALNTTMRGGEIKQLHWRDIDFMGKTLAVRHSKTDAGERVIPLNANAYDVVLALYRRAQSFGEVRPEHYIFPACEASHFDPTRPQTSWRTAWRNLTRLITCPACGTEQNPGKVCRDEKCRTEIEKVKSSLSGLRFHDLRHHAITELAESRTSDSTILQIAGHVSPKMLRHYSHVRLQAMRTALDALSMKRPGTGGYDTNNDTKRDASENIPPQVIENMVSAEGFEPSTHALKGHCSTN